MSAEPAPVARLHAVLARTAALNALPNISASLIDEKAVDLASLRNAAVCFDANVILRAATHADRAQIVDYFGSRHSGPLIVSAQAVQEFWNNYTNVIETVSKGIEKRLTALRDGFAQMEEIFEPFRVKFEQTLAEFERDYNFMLDPKSRASVSGFIEMLNKRGYFAEAPRLEFLPYVEQRAGSRTPPGFKDRGSGDFYVWIDFLLGLASVEQPYAKAIFVTDDKKVDWARGRVPHPTLAVEVGELVGKPLEIWSLAAMVAGARSA